jgi:hypothetical protein
LEAKYFVRVHNMSLHQHPGHYQTKINIFASIKSDTLFAIYQRNVLVIVGTTIFLWSISNFSPASAQEISSAELKMKCALQSSSRFLPKDLLNTKTVAIVSMNLDNEDKSRGDWRQFAKEAHFYVRRLGIDAVVYYYVDDLISGHDAKRAISEKMVERGVNNILMLSHDNINGRKQYLGVIAPFNQQPSFVAQNQNAWKSQTSDLEILFRNLARAIENAGLERENLMILETPEYFRYADILPGRRMETFNTDLRIDRIAVPLFDQVPPIESTAGIDSKMSQAIKKANEEVAHKNSMLEQIMTTYPYKYKIVPYQYNEKEYLTQGFQFVLMQITSSAKEVRLMLGYDDNDEVKEITSITVDEYGKTINKTIPIETTVTKFYVRHINSGEVFLGEQWDADAAWNDALRNHLNNLMGKLKAKN